MGYVIDKEACIACGACESVCPVEAIAEDDGKYIIDGQVCIECGACEGVCPMEIIFPSLEELLKQ